MINSLAVRLRLHKSTRLHLDVYLTKKVISTRSVYGTPQNTYITQLHTTLVASSVFWDLFSYW